jgi:hypothetical protein
MSGFGFSDITELQNCRHDPFMTPSLKNCRIAGMTPSLKNCRIAGMTPS